MADWKAIEAAAKDGSLVRLRHGDQEAIGYWSNLAMEWVLWRPLGEPQEKIDWEPTEWADLEG